MIEIPAGLPTLSAGKHEPGEGKACLMEYIALLAGETWSDSPKCTHPVLAKMAQVVNDRLPDSERYRLVPLIGRLFGTGDRTDDTKLSVQLAIFCAESVLDKVRPADRTVCAHAVATAARWVVGVATREECQAAADAAYSAAAANAAYSTYSAYSAEAAAAAEAAQAAAYATYSAANAAEAAANAAAAEAAYSAAYSAYSAAAYSSASTAEALIGLLTGLIDEYDRITGRVEHRDVSTDELHSLALAVSSPDA